MNAFAATLTASLALALGLGLGSCGGGEPVPSPRTTTEPAWPPDGRTTTEPARPPAVTIRDLHGSLHVAAALHSGRMELTGLRLSGRCRSARGVVTLSLAYPPPHAHFFESIPGVRPAPRRLRVIVPCRAGRFRLHRAHTAVMQGRGRFARSTGLKVVARQEFAAAARITLRATSYAIE